MTEEDDLWLEKMAKKIFEKFVICNDWDTVLYNEVSDLIREIYERGYSAGYDES